ncbi:MAG: hypothetical protein L7W43_17780, partial [Rubripirellula sp.]|nr:hypothetical protein [Rubripirellula sp.]
TSVLAPVAVRITNKCPVGEADFSSLEFHLSLFSRHRFPEWVRRMLDRSGTSENGFCWMLQSGKMYGKYTFAPMPGSMWSGKLVIGGGNQLCKAV